MPLATFPPSTASRRAPSRVALLVAACVWALILGTIPASAQTDEDALRAELERVEAEQAELSASLTEATAKVDDLTARLAQVRDRSAALRAELEVLSERSEQAQQLMDARIRDIYKGDRVNDMLAFATGTSVADISRRTHYVTAMTRRQRARFEQASALVAATQARRAELGEVDSRLNELVAEAAQAQADLDARFAAAGAASDELQTEIALAEAEARRLAEEAAAKRRAAQAAAKEAEAEEAARQLAEAEAAERRAAAASRSAERAREAAQVEDPAPSSGGGSPGSSGRGSSGGGSSGGSGGGSSGGSGGGSAPTSGGKACPQDNPRSFTDTWGAPRSGGRTHKGTDIFGARGGNVFAITGGVVEWTRYDYNSSSGLFLSLRGDDGHTYWYMHLQDFVAGAGQRVGAGQLIAHNGDTGNARGTTPHIHFEYHPGGGSAINPYPMLKEVCG